MKDMRLMIARELNKIAKELVAVGDYEYIYDPEHRKHPGGGYQKTEKGWQKGKQEKGDTTGTMNKEQKLLDKRSGAKHWNIRRDVAKDEHTHPETLNKLSNDTQWIVRRTVAENKNTPLETLDKLSRDEEQQVRQQVAKNKNTSAKILNNLSEDEDMTTRVYVAHNPNTSAETLDKLSNEKPRGESILRSVREVVADNPNTSSQTLDKLSNDSQVKIRRSVAYHKNTSSETLDKLANDEDEYVRGRVAENPNTSDQTLERMSKVRESGYGPAYSAGFHLNLRKKEKAQKEWQNGGFDISKLSPEMREKVKDWDTEDVIKFITWLKENRG